MHSKFAKMSNAQLGSHLENRVKMALSALKKETNHGLTFHRFYDTKSAGAFLPEMPADFLVGAPKGAFLLEAKASFLKTSLASCLSNAVSGGQAAEAHLWCRSGPNQKSLFVFFCADTEEIEIWDGALVAATYIKSGARLTRDQVLLKGPATDFKKLLREVLL
jgi:hypothetical protein